MANANGIGFLIYFLLELHLSCYWVKTFNLHRVCQQGNPQIFKSFEFYNRIILACVPLMAGVDNLRLFAGTVLTEQQAMKPSFKNLYQTSSFLHLVVLSYFILASYFYAISSRAAARSQPQDSKTTSFSTAESDAGTSSSSTSSTRLRIGWVIASIVTLFLFVNGLYTFVETSKHIEFKPQYSLYKYQLDHDWLDRANAFIQIGHQIPAIVCVATLSMNIVVWCKYKFYIPFLLTLLTVVAMGVLVSAWYDAFFFAANFFEYTLFLGYFAVDRFMFYVPVDSNERPHTAELAARDEVEV